MSRSVALAVLLVAGALTLAVAACRREPPDEPKIAAITQVRDRLYLITGGGGNTAVFVTETGVVIVDTKLPGWGPAILDKIRTVTDKPVTMIINTHSHHDHTSGNPFFGANVAIVAHDRTKANMAKMPAFQDANRKFLPTRTFTDRMSLLGGPDAIDLYYFGRAHTDGDIVVVFPALRAAHAGDLFAFKELPRIDGYRGGDAVEYVDTITKAAAGVANVDTVITGHSTVMTWSDLQGYADFNQDFLAWTRQQISEGKTIAAAAAGYRLPARFQGYAVPAPQVLHNTQLLYEGLKAVPPPKG
jgi:glyoxylase-like metal-dependent hydrolase (beta-lactamase superfamily II)